MKREQIIEILENHEVSFYGTEGGYGVQECDYSKIADAILALPLDTELLKKELIKFRNYFNNECYGSIEEWIIDEYIENKGIKYERD
jgi:hypothetical protein